MEENKNLNEQETALVFAKLVKEKEVKNFDAYFAMGAESREKQKKAREEEKNKKINSNFCINIIYTF